MDTATYLALQNELEAYKMIHGVGQCIIPTSHTIPVRATPVEAPSSMAELAPFRSSSLRNLKEAGNIERIRSMTNGQISIACLWMMNRRGEKGIDIEQEVSVPGWIWNRKAGIRLSVGTWG